MAVNLSIAYNLQKADDWPTLARGQTIPKHLWSSSPLGKVPQRRVALGFVRAATLLLTGQARVRVNDNLDISIAYDSSSTRHGARVALSTQDMSAAHKWIWHGSEGASAGALLIIAQAVLYNAHEEVLAAWKNLLQHVKAQGNLPMAPSALRVLAQSSPAANDAMLHLSDAIYFAIKEADAEDNIGINPQTPLGEFENDASSKILNPEGVIAEQGLTNDNPAALARLTRTGGTALLVGPTGTFKTEHAKRAAIDSGSKLHVLKGRPGIEDRDFYGGIYPTPDGPQWIDGPLTKAFRHAQDHKTVLVIDELLRFEPIYLGALIGALDTYTSEEINLIGGQAAGEGRHYHLELPNGQGVTAPVENLTIIATTNIGNGYVQFQELDDALLGRFQLILDYDKPPAEETTPIYTEAAGGNQKLAKAASDLEKITHERHVGEEGLLARPANPRVIINLLHETNRRTSSGEPLEGAFAGAVEATVIPYCAPRDSMGRLETSTVAMLIHETKRIAQALA